MGSIVAIRCRRASGARCEDRLKKAIILHAAAYMAGN
jgi:hypothetical protein